MRKFYYRKNKGFTLVEILVVIAIVAVIGMMLVAIFTNTLRGSNKSQILGSIKQNGQAVLENMDKTIRDADNVICPPALIPSDTLAVIKDGIYTRYRFIPPNNIAKCSSANGCIQRDSPTKQAGETDPIFINRICTTVDPMTSATGLAILTDTDAQSGVSASGLFTRNKQPGFKDNVTVAFTLRPGVGAPASITGQIDPVTFQTTIELR